METHSETECGNAAICYDIANCLKLFSSCADGGTYLIGSNHRCSVCTHLFGLKVILVKVTVVPILIFRPAPRPVFLNQCAATHKCVVELV
jgi:hypothetical protein